MRLAALFSGGKDSTYAIHRAKQEGHDVVRLLSFASENPDSYMFHHPNIHLTRLLAEALRIPITLVRTPGKKEEELNDLERALRILKPDIDGVSAGALASRYQYDRVAAICRKLDLQTYTPAWQADPETYMRMLVKEGFVFCLTKVACDGLDDSWLGRVIDSKALEELVARSKRYLFHVAGEGGEFESLVLDCPAFSKQLVIDYAKQEWDGEVGVWTIETAHLEAKLSC